MLERSDLDLARKDWEGTRDLLGFPFDRDDERVTAGVTTAAPHAYAAAQESEGPGGTDPDEQLLAPLGRSVREGRQPFGLAATGLDDQPEGAIDVDMVLDEQRSPALGTIWHRVDGDKDTGCAKTVSGSKVPSAGCSGSSGRAFAFDSSDLGRSLPIDTGMRARTVTFHVDAEAVAEVLRAIDEEILPVYRELPEFQSFVILDLDGMGERRELVGISVWDESLSSSSPVVAEFRRQMAAIVGNPSTMDTYGVLRHMTRTEVGRARDREEGR